MKRERWFQYDFADGYRCICRGMSKNELRIAERDHGKLISKKQVW